MKGLPRHRPPSGREGRTPPKRRGWPVLVDAKSIVRGAGGIVYRPRPTGDLPPLSHGPVPPKAETRDEVLLIHRPRLEDWSFPKGRLDPGETSEACALREVAEETGYTCELSEELPTVRYMDRSGRPKEIRFWKMIPMTNVVLEPNTEVDKITWMDARDAFTKLTHKTDRLLLKRLLHQR